MEKNYSIVVPALDETGPVNVACDIGRAAAAAGWRVRIFSLAEGNARNDTGFAAEIRRLKVRDLWSLEGIVHTHCLRPDFLAWFFSWNRKCRLITTLHGHFPDHFRFDYSDWKVGLAWWALSRTLSRFDERVCISQTMQRFYRRRLPGLSYRLAYNFRSAPAGAGNPSPDIAGWIERQRAAGRIVLAYVGSLSERKNVRALVDAVIKHDDLCLVACGEGPARPVLEERLEAGDLQGRVLLAGYQPAPAAVVAASDMLVLASHAEGLPLVVIEAARVGRPSLMSNIAVHREMASMGLGAVFDRHGFSDFAAQARRLAARCSPDAIREVWSRNFSEAAGFQRYSDIFGSAKS